MKQAGFILFMTFLILGITGCAGSDDPQNVSNGFGSANIQIFLSDEAPDSSLMLGGARILSNSCAETGVSTIQIEVLNENNAYLTSASFSCDAGHGRVENIKIGSNRTFVVKGLDTEGNEIYLGTKINVTINEGVNNVGEIMVDRITNQSPTVSIATPFDGSTYTQNETITFEGSSTDTEDGILNDSSLTWSSSLDGNLGSGVSISISSLSTGAHTITLTARDSEDNSSTATIELKIVQNVEPNADYTNGFGMIFNLIHSGTFTMGSTEEEQDWFYNDWGYYNDMEIEHQVTLTQPFYIQTTEVTQMQWRNVLTEAERLNISIGGLSKTPSYHSSCGLDCPVEWVSWNDVEIFIGVLNQLGEGTYSLPTEAQWEYSARAGSTTPYANGNMTEYSDMYDCNYDANLDVMAWHCYNAHSAPRQVAGKLPNNWGLYDMHGNVDEWCSDWYGRYPSTPISDPTGPSASYDDEGDRVIRGGHYYSLPWHCRSADRGGQNIQDRHKSTGFRLVRMP